MPGPWWTTASTKANAQVGHCCNILNVVVIKCKCFFKCILGTIRMDIENGHPGLSCSSRSLPSFALGCCVIGSPPLKQGRVHLMELSQGMNMLLWTSLKCFWPLKRCKENFNCHCFRSCVRDFHPLKHVSIWLFPTKKALLCWSHIFSTCCNKNCMGILVYCKNTELAMLFVYWFPRTGTGLPGPWHVHCVGEGLMKA